MAVQDRFYRISDLNHSKVFKAVNGFHLEFSTVSVSYAVKHL